MGEAKRRKEQDPNYGKVAQKRSQPSKSKFDPKRITPMEMVLWAILFGGAGITFVWSYFFQ